MGIQKARARPVELPGRQSKRKSPPGELQAEVRLLFTQAHHLGRRLRDADPESRALQNLTVASSQGSHGRGMGVRPRPVPFSRKAMTISHQDLIAGMGSVGTFDITTTGRKTGQPRRLEIVYHVIDGRVYVSGQPRPQRRNWLANLDADPALTIHLRKPVRADVEATARVIDSDAERRRILERVAQNWRRTDVDL